MKILLLIAVGLLLLVMRQEASCQKCGRLGNRTGRRKVEGRSLEIHGRWCPACMELPVTEEEIA